MNNISPSLRSDVVLLTTRALDIISKALDLLSTDTASDGHGSSRLDTVPASDG